MKWRGTELQFMLMPVMGSGVMASLARGGATTLKPLLERAPLEFLGNSSLKFCILGLVYY